MGVGPNGRESAKQLAGKLETIMCTNAFEATMCKGAQRCSHRALLLGTSRCNHSCMPNAMRLNIGDGVGWLVSRLPISPGEELTVPYLDDERLRLPCKHRAALLRVGSIKSCLCIRCQRGVDEPRLFACAECEGGVRMVRWRHQKVGLALDMKEKDMDSDTLEACDACGFGDMRAAEKSMLDAESELEKLYFAMERRPQVIGDSDGQVLDAFFEQARFACLHDGHWLLERYYDLKNDHLQNTIGLFPFRPAVRMMSDRLELIACAEGILQCLWRFRGGVDPKALTLGQALGWNLERLAGRHAALLRDGARSQSRKDAEQHRWEALRNYELAYRELKWLYAKEDESRDLKGESHVTVFGKMKDLLA